MPLPALSWMRFTPNWIARTATLIADTIKTRPATTATTTDARPNPPLPVSASDLVTEPGVTK